MWRRIITIMILFTLFSNSAILASDYAEDNLCNNIIKSIVSDVAENEKVSRGNCVASVMKLVGIDRTTAEMYADMDFYQPVFYDICDDDLNAGYIILAKFSGVAAGVNTDAHNIGNFEPNRYVTIKECLTFMLRCLTGQNIITWDNVILQAKEIGLITEEEYSSFEFDESLTSNLFCTLLSRMLNMNRYLYWPTEEPQPGHAKEMQVDLTNSIKYIDWLCQNELYKNI